MEGGLGNQLFQYALYRQLRFMGRTVKMDVTTEYGREHDRQQMLWALDAVYEAATQDEINRLTGWIYGSSVQNPQKADRTQDEKVCRGG